MEYWWQNGDPKSFASDWLSGLGHWIPQTKHFLTGSWRLNGRWCRTELPVGAIPSIYTFGCLSFASKEHLRRFGTTCVLSLCLGLIVLIVLRVVVSCLLLKRPVAPMPFGRQRAGAQESLVVEDPWLVALCHYLKPRWRLVRIVSRGLMCSRFTTDFRSLSCICLKVFNGILFGEEVPCNAMHTFGQAAGLFHWSSELS